MLEWCGQLHKGAIFGEIVQVVFLTWHHVRISGDVRGEVWREEKAVRV